MSIEPGQNLLHYRLIEKIGEGGMGVVWKARDTTLDRDVAIKVLPDVFAGNPERLARFEREAKLLASLNHPHIAAIHGLHEDRGRRFLSMELVPGEDLAAALARGSVPLDEALSYGLKIAEAIECAHERGIVHRDLKPANVKITPDGDVKVLDFGLAKAIAGDPSISGPSTPTVMPTVTSAETAPGLILGTAAYMSPEQARGKPVDRRTDLWAFGCVLYEMLTGHVLYAGETVSDTVAKILEREPDWDRLPGDTPAGVRKLLRRCLTKDARKRQQSAGDARLEIEDALKGGEEERSTAATTPTGRRSILLPAILTGLLGAALAITVMITLRPRPEPPTVRKFDIPVEDLGIRFTGGAYPSPDGTRIAYIQDMQIMVRDLDVLEPRRPPLEERLTGSPLFWSPDGVWIGYQFDKKLWKIPAAGGSPISIGDLPGTGEIIHAIWGADDRITFSSWRGGMYSIIAEGGAAEPVIEVDPTEIVDFHRVEMLPDGSLLYTVHFTDSLGGIWRFADGVSEVLLKGRNPVYSPTGHILYNVVAESRNTRLMAVPYSVSTSKITGDPFRVADNAHAPYLTSDGLLVYIAARGANLYQFVWLDREGRALESLGEPTERLSYSALSPDNTQIAFVATVEGDRDIWILDLEDGTRRRITFPDAAAKTVGTPAWFPDGRTLIFSRRSNLRSHLFTLPADGSGNEQLLFRGHDPSLSPDGRHLVYVVHGLDANDDIWLAERGDGGNFTEEKRQELLATSLKERDPSISPDGRFLAYRRGEGDEGDIFLTQFPSGEGQWQVSTGGGRYPRWHPDGNVLYFVNDDNELVEVSVRLDTPVRAGTPLKLFGGRDSNFRLRYYTPTSDDRFLVEQKLVSESDLTFSIVVVENWYEEFRDR